MKKLNNIGMETKQAQQLAEGLQELLAGYQVFYANIRGFHWNIRGEKFFELHVKFEELYNDLIIKIDEIAERILTLGYAPEFRYSQYLILSKIHEAGQTADGTKNVESLIESFSLLIAKQRELLELSAGAGDEGTNSLMSDYIREQEKRVWMYSAFLNRN
jgi:starvation-inducible DNA-binding protein